MRGDTKMKKTKDISVLNSFKKIFSTRDFGREAAERFLERISSRNSGAFHVMSKEKLIDNVASDIGFTKRETKKVVECIFENISDCLARGEVVRLAGFGTFGVRKRAARMARNPRTGEKIAVGAMNTPSFEASREFKKTVE